ncbi:coiled-coil domain-containing protein [Sulfurimonas sp.]|uniref:coiled-coil domain-containing protein n=1 Tax=Sulfurimonas sp. TaxID=2022749 RepID=UPI0035658F45
MFDNDLLLAFAFMAILFLRQISILKQPNKINYAPLMIGIGAISSVVHFIIHPDITDIILLLRESFLPLLVALLLYIVMNILHQTQQTQNARTHDEFARVITTQVSELKEFMAELEGRMILSQQDDRKAQEEMREKFKHDIKALNAIELNQGKFLEKFDDMDGWHKGVSKAFDDFTNVQLPELDNVVHKHIDILRVAEQDHYNQIKTTLDKAVENRLDISEDIDDLKDNLSSMKSISDDIAKSITKHTLEQLSGVTKTFENQIVSLKSHTEGISTSLYESENRLNAIREQSEMIMKQMLLSSKKMNDLEKQNSGLHDIYSTIKDLVGEIEAIKADYVKAQSQLSSISTELNSKKEAEIDAVKEQMEALIITLTKRIDDSLEKLHQHYHIASDDITQSVQILAKKAQLQKGYRT